MNAEADANKKKIKVLETQIHEKVEAVIHHKQEKNEAMKEMGQARDIAERLQTEKQSVWDEL